MDLFKALLSATDASDQAVIIANLLICILGFLWVVSSYRDEFNKSRWKIWSCFWGALCGYYFLGLFSWPNPLWWVPFIFLDLSVFILFFGALKALRLEGNKYLYSIILIVVIARLLDIYQVYKDPSSLAYFHQLLAGLSLIAWAWIHRLESPSNSLVLLTYGLIQMPFKQLFTLASTDLYITADEFVQMTFLAYFIGKFALIPATLSLMKNEIKGTNYQAHT